MARDDWHSLSLQHYETRDQKPVERSLAERLEERITHLLLRYQRLGLRDRIREDMLDTWNPRSTAAFLFVQTAAGRNKHVQALLEDERDAGTIWPWTHSQAAAMTFEGIFEGGLVTWLNTPTPTDANELDPRVTRFVRRGVGWFTRLLGAQSSSQGESCSGSRPNAGFGF